MVRGEIEGKMTIRDFFSRAKDKDNKKIFHYVEEEFCKGKAATKVMFLKKNTKMATKYVIERYNRVCLKMENLKCFSFNTSVKQLSTKNAETLEKKWKEELGEREFSKKEEQHLIKATYLDTVKKGINARNKRSIPIKKKTQ